MPTKVLVAYGTTNGSTARIAETIADVLRKRGVPTEAVPAHSVTDVESYDAVVVGGGLYAGRWHKDARRFVRRHGRVLAGRPLWFFSSGPLDASATEKDIPPVPGVRRVMTRLGVRAHVTFGAAWRKGPRESSPGRSFPPGRAGTSVTSGGSRRGPRTSEASWCPGCGRIEPVPLRDRAQPEPFRLRPHADLKRDATGREPDGGPMG